MRRLAVRAHHAGRLRSRSARQGRRAHALAWGLGACVWIAPPGALDAQTPDVPPPAVFVDSTTVVPGPEYGADWFWRLLRGSNYRALWGTPLRTPVLDLSTFDGGLRVQSQGRELEVETLYLMGARGHQYSFRSLNWDPFTVLPSAVRNSVFHDFIKDQVSGSYPAAELLARPFIEAARVPYAQTMVVVLPRDSTLGQFSAHFAGALGVLRRSAIRGSDVVPPLDDATEIVTTDELIRRLNTESSAPVDGAAYLTARLLDLFFGEWIVMRRDMRWAHVPAPSGPRWVPIPGPRREAFSNYNAVILKGLPLNAPGVPSFGESYAPLDVMVWNVHDLDRRFLTSVSHETWDSVTKTLIGRLSDDVITAAVHALPPDYLGADSARLSKTLRARRNGLAKESERFYALTNRAADIRATGGLDSIEIVRTTLPSVDVRIFAVRPTPSSSSSLGDTIRRTMPVTDPSKSPYFDRRFTPTETHEVRVYLGGSHDIAVVRGEGGDGITLRVVRGDSTDRIESFVKSDEVKRYGPPKESEFTRYHVDSLFIRVDSVIQGATNQPRDWGTSMAYPPWLGFGTDIGLFVGGGVQYTRYGFRKYPFASRYYGRIGYSTALNDLSTEIGGVFHEEQSKAYIAPLARWSGIDVINYFGQGNETQRTRDDQFYKVRQRRFTLTSEFGLPVSRHTTLTFAPFLTYSRTDNDSTRLVNQQSAYGAGTFGRIGALMGVKYDTRDLARVATRGFYITGAGRIFPGVWNVLGTFGEIQATAATYFTFAAPVGPTVAVRVGGKQIWGPYTFDEAAYIGGDSTIRGAPQNRWAGDASLYGNLDIRQPIKRFTRFMPGRLGVLGFADVGRVFLDGESSNVWHPGFGGGLWYSLFDATNTLVITIGHADARTSVYFSAGFMY